jgi:hypothetical protein
MRDQVWRPRPHQRRLAEVEVGRVGARPPAALAHHGDVGSQPSFTTVVFTR